MAKMLRTGLMLAAVQHLSCTDSSDDTLSLLQTKAAVLHEPGEEPVDVSFDKAFQGSPPDCDPARRMNLEKCSLAYSNLGNMGPDQGQPEGILFTNILADSGQNIDLHLSALSAYTSKKPEGNGKVASFGRIDIATGTSVSVKFSFYEGGTNTPFLMRPFTMSFVDLDEQRDEGMARESVTIMDEHEYILTNTTSIVVSTLDGATSFSSSEFGSGKDNPRGAMELTRAQKDKTVQVVFPAISSFSATLAVGPHPPHWTGSSRNILFAGQSNVWCEPDDILPSRALCETMDCPLGFKLKRKKKIRGVFCAGEDCTTEDDLATCCEADLCSNARLLSLRDDAIQRNNLGNQGPDSGPEGILFRDVFPHSADTINMLINAGAGYQRAPDKSNDAMDNIARINLVTGATADLTFRFFDAATSKPVKVPPFYVSFLDFDENQIEGRAREYLTVNYFKKYVLDEHTVVRALPADTAEESMLFHSTTFGIGKDNVRNSRYLSDEQKTKAVSILVPKGKTFHAKFEVAPHPGAHKGKSSNRYLQIAGATNQVC